jgi:hypothetical protein
MKLSMMRRIPRVLVFAALLAMAIISSACHRHEWHAKKVSPSNEIMSPAQVQNGVGRVPANNSQLDFGVGLDSLTDVPKSRCVQFANEDVKPAAALAQKSYLRMDDAHTAEDMANKQGFSFAASFDTGAYSGDASADFARSEKSSRYSENLIINEYVENEVQLLNTEKVSLTKEGRKALDSGLLTFRNLCGDQFIMGKVTGGSISAILNVESDSYESQQTAHLKLHAASAMGSANAAAESEVDELRKAGRLTVSITREGPAEDWPDSTVPELMAYARTYPCKVAVVASSDLKKCHDKNGKPIEPHPWTISFLTASYDQFLEEKLIEKEQAEFYDRESPYILSAYSYRAGLGYIENHKPQFPPYSDKRMTSEKAKINTEIGKIRAAARDCDADSKKCGVLARVEFGLLPDRANSYPWQNVDPTVSFPRGFGSAMGDDKRVVEIAGSWWAHCENNRPVSLHIYPGGSDTVQFKLLDGSTVSAGSYRGPWLMPKGSTALYYVIDGPPSAVPAVYQDNCLDPDPLRIRIIAPVFPDEYFLPPGLNAPAAK